MNIKPVLYHYDVMKFKLMEQCETFLQDPGATYNTGVQQVQACNIQNDTRQNTRLFTSHEMIMSRSQVSILSSTGLILYPMNRLILRISCLRSNLLIYETMHAGTGVTLDFCGYCRYCTGVTLEYCKGI